MTATARGAARLGLALLICLDTLEIADGPGRHAPLLPWAFNATRLLEHARGQGWMVAHMLRQRPTGLGRWRDAFGLSPRPDERVFHRGAPSAFSSAEFREVVPANADLVIVGRSNDGALLSTAREGLERGFAVVVASDAVAAPAGERARLGDLALLGPDEGLGRFTLQNTVGLQAARAPLRLVQGGRLGQGGIGTPPSWRRP